MATNCSSTRTPSKNRGKTVTTTQQQSVHKCQFNSDNTMMFLQLVIAEMDVGNRQPCGLSMTGYKNVANKFLDKTGLLHSAKQMKNKFDNLKKDWVAWNKLENAAQGLTGLGYDQETGLFTAPDHWWAKMQAMNNRCAKFKTKPLEHLELMEQVYSQSVADGSANAKRCKRAAPGTVASSMDNLVETISKQSRELKIKQYVVTRKGDNTVGDCLARLMSTPRLEPGGKLFSFTCAIMDSPDNRDIIMALPVDYIVNWLTEKRACTPANVGRERERDVRLFGSDVVVDMD